jgi:hypothetical protein
MRGYFKLLELVRQGRTASHYANGTGGEQVKAETRAIWLVSFSAARFSPVTVITTNYLGRKDALTDA